MSSDINAIDMDLEGVHAWITGGHNTILLDLEKKLKLSSQSSGQIAGEDSDGALSTVIIQARDFSTGQNTAFNLKECYMTGVIDDSGGDDIQVIGITIDGSTTLSTSANLDFASFGPWTDSATEPGPATVEVISGLGFHTGLGANDIITMTVLTDSGDRVLKINCIVFVQNSATLLVSLDEPSN